MQRTAMRVSTTVILVLAVVPPAAAQTGRVAARQVQEFRLVASVGHFDITCAPGLDGEAEPIGRKAEHAYQAVAASLRHELSLRPLLVLFATTDELRGAVQTGTVPGNREHVLVPLDLPASQLGGTLVHELSHVFLWDILPASRHQQIPPWLIEGMAELHRGDWDASDLETLRNMVEASNVPTPQTLEIVTQPADDRRHVIVGHAMFEFLIARAGVEGPRRLLISLGQNLATAPLDVYLATLGLAPDEFNQAFNAFLRTRFLVPQLFAA
jgi:hypothetical protein